MFFPSDCYDLCNGFSDTYDFCKNIGDMIWIDQPVTKNKSYSQDHANGSPEYPIEFPISKGIAYVSALCFNHLYRCYLWAKRYPNVKFIVGGPAVSSKVLKISEDIPKNLILVTKTVEEYFGINNFSYPWKLSVPKEIPKDFPVSFSYTIEDGCYWGKCNFCHLSKNNYSYCRRRKTFDFEFEDVDHQGEKVVRLTTEAFSPKMIKNIIPKLPQRKDILYRTFMRPSILELTALKNLEYDIQQRIIFSFGIEYPTTRMWNYINKGCNKKDIINIFKYLIDKGLKISIGAIIGWNNLIKEDLHELEEFMRSMPDSSNILLTIRVLLAMVDTEIYETYEKKEDIKRGPFCWGFHPELSEEQKNLNMKSKEIMLHYADQKKFETWVRDFKVARKLECLGLNKNNLISEKR
jgi:hypothetical protein